LPCDNSLQTFTVTFNSVGGSDVEPIRNVVNGSTIQRPADPTRDGHTFSGWFNGNVEFDFSSPITASITLTARWESTGGGYQEVIGWQWDGGQVSWIGNADNHGRNSSANISNQNPLTAAIHVGEHTPTPPAVWTWASVAAFFADRLFDNLTAIEITYTADLPLQLRIGSTAHVGDDQVFYFAELPQSSSANTLVLSLSEFKAPEWMYTPDWGGSEDVIRLLSDVAKADIVSGLTFAHENYGQTVNVAVSSIKLIGISGNTTSIIPRSGSNAVKTNNALEIKGFRAGNLSLNVARAGMYNVSIHSVDGRILAQTSRDFAVGANSLNIGQNLAKGVVIVRIQGMDATLIRQILIR
jgi:uncharacterized repeat protein (TIGR02543 family)